MCNCQTCRDYRAIHFQASAEQVRKATAFARAHVYIKRAVENNEPLEPLHEYEPAPRLLVDPCLDPDSFRYR